jgi:hypothetical protein
MGNGEWGMREWVMGNGEWGMGNHPLWSNTLAKLGVPF